MLWPTAESHQLGSDFSRQPRAKGSDRVQWWGLLNGSFLLFEPRKSEGGNMGHYPITLAEPFIRGILLETFSTFSLPRLAVVWMMLILPGLDNDFDSTREGFWL